MPACLQRNRREGLAAVHRWRELPAYPASEGEWQAERRRVSEVRAVHAALACRLGKAQCGTAPTLLLHRQALLLHAVLRLLAHMHVCD